MVRIQIEGFPDDLRVKGEAEILQVLEAFKAFEKANKKFPATLECVDEIVVTPQFEETIRGFLRDRYGEIGDSYSTKRHGIIVGGRALSHIEDGEIRFRIVISNDSIGDWQDSSKFWRVSTLAHEMFHAIMWKAAFDVEGVKTPRDQWAPQDYYNWILDNATEEYSVDKLTNTFLRLTCTGEDDQPFELHEALVSAGWDYLGTALGMLDGMREFFAQVVSSFQFSRIDITALNDQALLYISDMVTVLAHCAATRDDLEGWADDERRLMESDGHNRFLSAAWPAIHAFWKLPRNAKEDRFKAAQANADSAIETIYQRCGLELTRTDNGGTYINVSIPPTLRK